MVCSKCGYMIDALDSECPKCHGKGVSSLPSSATSLSAPPPPPPKHQSQHPDGRIGAAFSTAAIGMVIGWNLIAIGGGSTGVASGAAMFCGAIGFVLGLASG